MIRIRALPLLLLLLPGAALAQDEPDSTPGPTASTWSTLRISKWTTLAATLAAAGYGVSSARAADTNYERLERACEAVPTACDQRTATGQYRDPELERQYQRVLRQDDRARTALLASQVGAVAAVVLFIVDLRHARAPRDIPYRPPRGLELAPGRDGLELRVRLPAR